MRICRIETAKVRDETGADYLGCPVAETDIAPELDRLRDLLDPDLFLEYGRNLLTRNDGSYHLTVVSPPEWRALNADMEPSVGLDFDVAMLGLGLARQGEEATYYTVCEAQAIQELRASLDLPPRDLHVTLAFRRVDIHGVPKDRSTLIGSER